MDESTFPLASLLVDRSYIEQGQQAIRKREGLAKALLSQRKLPKDGWDDASIENFLQTLALMDSNNFLDNAGVGEREGRVFSNIVARSHFRMSHGIGRSGDIAAVQPKAAGSSLMAKLVDIMAVDALKIAGLTEISSAITVPLATGMTLTLVLMSLRQLWKSPIEKRVVLWSRIDQKSCFKAIITAGFEVVIVPLIAVGDELRTDVSSLEALLVKHGNHVFCCVTTASCFAPRAPDSFEAVARLCSKYEVGHVVNNAYGLQCSATMKLLSRAMRVGRVDAIVQSTDKNFMVPVGGAVVAGQDKTTIDAIGKAYPGRASASPIRDLFITLLSMGSDGYKKLLVDREVLVDHMRGKLSEICAEHGERVLDTPSNRISFGITLNTFSSPSEEGQGSSMDATYLGSMLFTRCVSGTRVIRKGEVKNICGHEFLGFGSSIDNYTNTYMTAACAIGVTRNEVDRFADVLNKSMIAFKQKQKKEMKKKQTLSSKCDKAAEQTEVTEGVTVSGNLGVDCPPSSISSGSETPNSGASIVPNEVEAGPNT